jgi:ribosomal protein L37AE/L43A
MAETNDKKIQVYFCPKCESTNVKYIFGMGNIFGIIPRQKCQKCGLELNGFPILVTSTEALRKIEAEKNKSAKKSPRDDSGGPKKLKKKSVKKVKKSKKKVVKKK